MKPAVNILGEYAVESQYSVHRQKAEQITIPGGESRCDRVAARRQTQVKDIKVTNNNNTVLPGSKINLSESVAQTSHVTEFKVAIRLILKSNLMDKSSTSTFLS